MEAHESTTNTPHKSGFYYVRKKENDFWQAIVQISTAEYGNTIFIHCNRVLCLFREYEDVFNEKGFEHIIFSDNFNWSDRIDLKATFDKSHVLHNLKD